MARGAKYLELTFTQDKAPKQFLHGYSIVSDHVGSDGNRHLFLKREGAESKPAAPKKAAKKKASAAKANSSPAPSPATSFNPTELEN